MKIFLAARDSISIYPDPEFKASYVIRLFYVLCNNQPHAQALGYPFQGEDC